MSTTETQNGYSGSPAEVHPSFASMPSSPVLLPKEKGAKFKVPLLGERA